MFTTITTKTTPSMRKTGNPYWGCKKVHTFQVATINPDYTKSIGNRAAKQLLNLEWKTDRPVIGGRIKGTPFKLDKGKLYLVVQREKDLDIKYVDENGIIIPPEKIEPFIRVSKSRKQNDAGIKKEVVYRNYLFENVISVGKIPAKEFAALYGIVPM